MRHRLIILLTAAVQVTLSWITIARQSAVADDDYARLAEENRRTYVGYVETCRRCHTSGPVGQDVPLPGGATTSLKNDRWVLYDEVATWTKKDKHGQAYSVLLNKRSQEMGKLLNTQVHRDKRCLACHSAFPIHELVGNLIDNDGLIVEKLVGDYRLNVGVNCEGCHGPAADLRDAGSNRVALGWLGPHQVQPRDEIQSRDENDDKPWRFLDSQKKESTYGYWNVRSPVTRAQICASCHIGDAEQGRVLTHEMYAAGHPPLPGFELSTFVEQMPQHWRALADKPQDVREQFLELTDDKIFKDFQQDELVQTKAMLVGALVSLAEHLRLTVQLIDTGVDADGRPAWPELAQFECYACHHDLRNPSWRQSRLSTTATPGRPLIRGWTLALARLAVEAAEQDGNASESEYRLDDALRVVQAKPFGDVVQLRANAYAASRWLTETAHNLERRSISAAKGKQLRRRLVRLATDEAVDYDSARQYVWAFKVIDAELNDPLPQLAAIRSKYADETNTIFRLRVWKDGDESSTTVKLPTGPRTIDEFDVAKRYQLLNAYDPEKTQRVFKKIDRFLNATADRR